MMTNDELDKLRAIHDKRVIVSCCEYHAHIAPDCLSATADGDYKDVLICGLIDSLRAERIASKEFLAERQKRWEHG